MYRELVRLHPEESFDFSGVFVTFNLDEFLGPSKSDRRTFRSYLWENFLGHVNIKSENVDL